MRRRLLILGVGIAVVGALASVRMFAAASHAATPKAAPCSFAALPPATAAHVQVLWGHVTSLDRKGGRYLMRFDPAFWLGGLTASRAALEDTGSGDVPNDYYTVDESHRLYTYVVSPAARVTVIMNQGTRGLCSVQIPVSELAQIVKGKNPKHRPLFDKARGLGYWITVGFKYPNPVRSLDQQYQP